MPWASENLFLLLDSHNPFLFFSLFFVERYITSTWGPCASRNLFASDKRYLAGKGKAGLGAFLRSLSSSRSRGHLLCKLAGKEQRGVLLSLLVLHTNGSCPLPLPFSSNLAQHNGHKTCVFSVISVSYMSPFFPGHCRKNKNPSPSTFDSTLSSLSQKI